MRAVLLSLLIVLSWSGLSAKTTLLGFSPDGRYCAYAWEDYDPDRNYELECRVMETSSNQYAGTHLRVKIPVRTIMKSTIDSSPEQFDMGPKLAWQELQGEINNLLAQYNIEKGNTGEKVFQYDLNQQNPLHLEDQCRKQVTFTLSAPGQQDRIYKLVLQEKPADSAQDGPHAPRIFSLRLSRGVNTKYLQQDKYLPASRKSPYAYSIHQVWVYQGCLLVFLQTITPHPTLDIPVLRMVPVSGDFKKNQTPK